ncbi:hypothetical protein QVD17_19191 [Tagetes erecta]|uniref:Uncharacterized protein n=1 Tax=Tagetes erecta TaxID=13708 RepID=A0AAD8KP89_TARER|nr:hypothetical protein QVD17_19191 [Tagetes erecta]
MSLNSYLEGPEDEEEDEEGLMARVLKIMQGRKIWGIQGIKAFMGYKTLDHHNLVLPSIKLFFGATQIYNEAGPSTNYDEQNGGWPFDLNTKATELGEDSQTPGPSQHTQGFWSNINVL